MISQQRVRSCIEQALQRTELEGEADELMELGLRPPRKCGEFAVVRCASTHMLTLHPQEKQGSKVRVWTLIGGWTCWLSFRRQKLTLVGLQETKCRKPKAKYTGRYRVFSSAAGPRGSQALKFGCLRTGCSQQQRS